MSGEFQLYSAAAGGFIIRVNLDEQIIGGNPSFNNLESSAAVTWVSGTSTNLATNGSGTVSDGTLQICITLHHQTGAIPEVSGIIGARVPIEKSLGKKMF